MSDAHPTWKAFESAALLEARVRSGETYHEFLERPSLSCGIYALAAGSEDLQSPHDEDEVYYVISGRARVRVEDEEHVVGPGSILFVGALSEHSFVEIEEDATFLVFFASGEVGEN